jgi:hypothetical protein
MMMRIVKLAALGSVCLSLSGCLVGTAIDATAETIEAGVELTGATVKTTAGVTGAVIGGTVDAVVPGDQRAARKEKEEAKKDKKKK